MPQYRVKLDGKTVFPDRALTLISTTVPRWKRGRSIAVRYSNGPPPTIASATQTGKCLGDDICVLVTKRNRTRIEFVYVATVVKVSGEQKKNPRSYAVYSKHYCPDKATILFAYKRFASMVA